MGTTAMIDVDVAFVGRLAFSTDRVVMLQERRGPRRLALEPVDAATGEVVEQVTIGRLVREALDADVTLERDGGRRQVEARAGDAVALALLAGAPIRVVAAVMDAAGFDPKRPPAAARA